MVSKRTAMRFIILKTSTLPHHPARSLASLCLRLFLIAIHFDRPEQMPCKATPRQGKRITSSAHSLYGRF